MFSIPLTKNIQLEGDRTIWITVFLLSLLSILVVYSTAGWTFLFNHLIKLSLGIICMYIVHKWKFKYFSKIGLLSFWLSIILLLVVLTFGITINGASRWLSLAGQRFQPSDIAKLAILLFMARQLSKNRQFTHTFKDLIWYVVSPLILICILILPNNFSTSALVFFNGLMLLYLAKISIKHIMSIIILALFSAFLMYGIAKHTSLMQEIMPRSSTWVSRIDSYFLSGDKEKLDKDYQVTQALVAIKNGGLTGLGPGKSVQRNILPFSSSDFIFAIMVEEYGLILGGLAPLLLYLILLFRGLRIAMRTESLFGQLVVSGLMFSLVLQAFINILVSVDILPVTGQTLPLISMGGTSILFTCISIGIILSISRDSTDRNYENI
ncbi:MAG: FtsW/RodA/SpoVE family cell cycle protein [Bacteroidota bacterium]|nr:FtsW/RodA/SpoVE family cell cycle protein [Bacteroidota bacterium]